MPLLNANAMRLALPPYKFSTMPVWLHFLLLIPNLCTPRVCFISQRKHPNLSPHAPSSRAIRPCGTGGHVLRIRPLIYVPSNFHLYSLTSRIFHCISLFSFTTFLCIIIYKPLLPYYTCHNGLLEEDHRNPFQKSLHSLQSPASKGFSQEVSIRAREQRNGSSW